MDVREPLRVVNRSPDQDMCVKGAPHGRAEPPSFLWPVNSVWATLGYSSSPVGGIELIGGSAPKWRIARGERSQYGVDRLRDQVIGVGDQPFVVR